MTVHLLVAHIWCPKETGEEKKKKEQKSEIKECKKLSACTIILLVHINKEFHHASLKAYYRRTAVIFIREVAGPNVLYAWTLL